MKKGYKKIDHQQISEENFELKSYFKYVHIAQARTKFRIRSLMKKTVKTNFPSDNQFASDLWKCWHCPMVDTQSHVRVCPAYEHLRKGKDLNKDLDLARYFCQVIKLREEI